MPKVPSADQDEALPPELVAPRSFIHYLGATWKVWRPSFGRAMLAFFVPIVVTTALVDALGFLIVNNSFDTGAGAKIFVVRFLLLGLVTSCIAGLTTIVFAGSVAGGSPTIKEARAAFRPALPTVLLAALIASVLAFGAWLVFGPLGSIAGPLLFLGPPLLMQVIVLERRKLNAASLRMRELIQNSAARVMIYLLCAALMMGMLQVALIGPVSLYLEGLLGAVVYHALYALIGSLTFSFMAAFTVVTYIELRARTGGVTPEDLVPSSENADEEEATTD